MGAVFMVILILLLLGAMPTYSHSRNWGYAASGTLGILLVILIVLMLVGQVPWWGYGTGPVVGPVR